MSTKQHTIGLCRRIIAFTLAFALAIPININLSLQQPETVYAAGIDTDAGAREVANTVVNGIGSSGSGGNSKIPNGVSNARTGYLCYLTDKNGTKLSYPAYAFYSEGFSEIPGSEWICKSRQGHVVSEWTDVAPWGFKPWEGTGTPTHMGDIKNWMASKTLDPSKYNCQVFVQDVWGKYDATATKKFEQDEYVIVIETIMNFQYSKASGTGGLTSEIISELNSASRQWAEDKVKINLKYGKYETELKNLCQRLGVLYSNNVSKSLLENACVNVIQNEVFEKSKEEAKKLLADSGANREFLGAPKIGTVANLIDANTSNTPVFKSYTNRVALFAERIEKSEAGFTAYPGAERDMSDAEVHQYGLAMFIVHYTDPAAQTTCDEPNPNPHKAPQESTGTCNIVKNYRTKNDTTGAYTDDGCFIKTDVTSKILIEEEELYKVVGWKTSSTKTPSEIDSISWNPPSALRNGTTAGSVDLADTEFTLYVLLEKKEADPPEVMDYNYKLTETQITRRVWFSAPDNWTGMTDISTHDFDFKKAAHNNTCNGHSWTCSGCVNNSCNCTLAAGATCTTNHGTSCPGHTAHCDWGKWTDMTMRFSLLNSKRNDYPDVLATKDTLKGLEVSKSGLTKRWEETSVSWTDENDTAHIPAYSWGTNVDGNWDYICVLMRGKDKLTLAKYINDGEGKATPTNANANTDIKDASTSGFAVADTDQGTRQTATYYETFAANFDKDGSGDYKTKREIKSGSGHGDCSASEITASISVLTLNTIKVKIETYSGSADGGTNNTDCNPSDMVFTPFSGGIAKKYASGHMVPSGGTISFRPYIRMKYDTRALVNQTAYVLGEYDRQLSPNSYAELEWDQPGSRTNLTMESGQWSIHAQPVNDRGSNSVLPGGAQIELSIAKGDRRTITARTYQPIVVDEHGSKGKTQVEKSGGTIPTALTQASVEAAHESYVNSVVSGFEAVHVEQYVSPNEYEITAGGVFSSGKAVHEGGDITFLHNTSDNTASSEDKYYFRQADTQGNRSNEGDLDAIAGTTAKEFYTFRADTSGIIYMNDVPILQQNQDESSLTGKAKEIDEKTYIVRKLVDAIERNTGNDGSATWVSSGKWYNEAFDGITIEVQTTQITVGFNSPALRSSVLDVKLITLFEEGNKSNTKATFFKKYFSSAFSVKPQIISGDFRRLFQAETPVTVCG